MMPSRFMAISFVGAMAVLGDALPTPIRHAPAHAPGRATTGAAHEPAAQDLPYYPYQGRWTFVRIRTNEGRRGFGRGWGRGVPGWAHDYPDADRNFSKILKEITFVQALQVDYGGNVLTFDDPRLGQFPLAYVSEPGEWEATDAEARGLREYLLKGGFVVFDDFTGSDMYNLMAQMKRVLPELDFLPLDRGDAIFDSFFEIDPAALQFPGTYRFEPEFWGLFMENDKSKRMLVVANNHADFGEYWEFSDRGFYPVDISNDAYQVGVNYVVYALTH